jgi:hypothetical protein
MSGGVSVSNPTSGCESRPDKPKYLTMNNDKNINLIVLKPKYVSAAAVKPLR